MESLYEDSSQIHGEKQKHGRLGALEAEAEKRVQRNRLLVGVLAIASLLLGYVALANDWMEPIWAAGMIRSGLLLGALWVAMPTRGRAAAWANVSPWWFVLGAAAMFFVMRRPLVLIPLALALFVLAIVIPILTGKAKR